MRPRSSTTSLRYNCAARWLHWSTAAVVPVQLTLGWLADAASQKADRSRLIHAHFQLGMAILALVAARLAWRSLRGAPPPLPDDPWRRRLAGGVHASLYALLLLMPASGYVIWIWMGASTEVFGIVELPRLFAPPADDERGRAWAWYVHHYAAIVLTGLTCLHVAAAVWREFVLKDSLISRRML